MVERQGEGCRDGYDARHYESAFPACRPGVDSISGERPREGDDGEGWHRPEGDTCGRRTDQEQVPDAVSGRLSESAGKLFRR